MSTDIPHSVNKITQRGYFVIWKHVMHFFRDKALAIKLQKNTLSEANKLYYFLLLTIFFSLITTTTINHAFYADTELTTYDFLVDISAFICEVGSLILAYKINKTGDNKNLIERYSILSVPIITKGLLLGIVLIIPSMTIDNCCVIASTSSETLEPPIETGPLSFTAMLLTCVYIFWRYYICFKYASGLKKEDE